ncbi:hypothetical protein ATE84_2509 [Aquimarina sp. MAR_2010_214]|uniref:hypothetical protein n=1 Tax=Aquimarina sp. MAR_2010_214 TaxID=1250026 RepID=UPI000C7084DE|nr:hypothetical protein [Aquimarina sp. MAR_2010_214]PKV50451.1 hypothetical protein ATE84_2509 [Aquimarina sp. MAR_2010_214]
MSNEFDELQRKWQKGKKDIESNSGILEETLSSITSKKNLNVRFHYGNIIILSITLIGISAFFYYVAPVKEILSRIGVALMIGGLLLRIIIECISVLKSKRIDVIDDVLKTTNNTIAFYKFRKRIHGPVTITIIALYTIGFYMITPEFSLYFTTWQMVMIDVSYVIGAIIFITFVRNSIRKEIRTLLEIIELKNKIIEENEE